MRDTERTCGDSTVAVAARCRTGVPRVKTNPCLDHAMHVSVGNHVAPPMYPQLVPASVSVQRRKLPMG